MIMGFKGGQRLFVNPFEVSEKKEIPAPEAIQGASRFFRAHKTVCFREQATCQPESLIPS
jgi:hypothetical protein